MNEIADDVFSKQVGTTYCEGLVNAGSGEVFYQGWKNCFGRRKKRSTLVLLGSMIGLASIIARQLSLMLRHVREDAGLGVPPFPLITNASESLNAVLKEKS